MLSSTWRRSFTYIAGKGAMSCVCIALLLYTDVRSATSEHNSESDERQVSNVESISASNSPKEDRILKSQVLGNIECKLTAGFGAARDVGVVELPRDNASDFAVLGPGGTRFNGSLPFDATWTRIGTSLDGSTVVGFGELRGGGGEFRPPDSPEPVRILQDNETIFESEKVWNFDVAADASSFIVHEPNSDGTSTLLVRNLITDTKTRYDLGTRFTPENAYESSFWLKYSLDFTEAVFAPAHADSMGLGTYTFYPMTEGNPRRYSVDAVESAVLVNSNEGYFVERTLESTLDNGRRSWKVYRKELDSTSEEETVIWERTIELEHFNGSMAISHNGNWLGLSAWEYVVLSTETGETKFHYRFVGEKRTQYERLRGVLPVNATVSEIGSLGSSGFVDDYLLFHSKRGNATACSRDRLGPYDLVTYRKCLREQRILNRFRWFHYVFDLNTVSIDGSPLFRREVFSDTECSEANSPLPGLRVRNGVLVYGPSS